VLQIRRSSNLLANSGDLVTFADGKFSYLNTDMTATFDAFLYEICDGHGACSLGSVSIAITNDPPDHLPIVQDDVVQVAPGGTAVGNVLANDSDPDGEQLLAQQLTAPKNGTSTISSDGTIAYVNTVPAATTDSLEYMACDGFGACLVGTVAISISPALPLVECTLSTQVFEVGDSVLLDLSKLFSAPTGQTLAYGANDLPSALSVDADTGLLTGSLNMADAANVPYLVTLDATTVPSGKTASEAVLFWVLPVGEDILRDGFDSAPQHCQ
jgi:hypothetical protein